MAGTLYFGDNLDVLRRDIRDESVDLVYLDPPFNAAASHNILFKAQDGRGSPSQTMAFKTTWQWCEASERAFADVTRSGRTDVADMLCALRGFLKDNTMMAYLSMMAVRLLALHKALKRTGSLYIHCDPRVSHYLKLLLDATFGARNYVNEIVWKRHSAHNDGRQGARHYGRVHDVILFYAKSEARRWNPIFTDYGARVVPLYRHVDSDGRRYDTAPLTGPGGADRGNPVYSWNGHTRAWRYGFDVMERLHAEGRLHYSRSGYPRQKRYLDESPGAPVQSVWTDIAALSGRHKERLNYKTQKPLALMERIIAASSDPGDVVLDPFCGCGTTLHAAEKLGRRWIGIDVTPLAVTLIEGRLRAAFPNPGFEVRGIPRDLDGARALAGRDKHLFQLWVISLIEAQPYRDGRKGADGGIDGLIYFRQEGHERRAIVSVKGGAHVGLGHIRELRGTIERLNEPIGIFVTLTPPTGPMTREAVAAGLYDIGRERVPRLQILTVEQALEGRRPCIPSDRSGAPAPRARHMADKAPDMRI